MNEKLEQLVAEFAKGRENVQLVKLMEELERSVLLIPAIPPKDSSEEMKQKLRNGESLPIPPGMERNYIVIQTNENKRILPIFTSNKKVEAAGQFPYVMKESFKYVVNYIVENIERFSGVVINPQADSVGLTNELIQMAYKRFKQMEQAQNMQTFQITAEQFHKLAHMRVTYELLPKLFYTDVQSAFTQLREQHEQLILDMYGTIYPENLPCPYTEDDISIMSLNLREDLQVTRIDMPERNISPSVALRVYIAWKDETKLYFYTIEKGEKDEANKIGFITNDGKHTIMKEAPDNGSEFEAIMELVDAMQ